jgi:hypothetical protein
MVPPNICGGDDVFLKQFPVHFLKWRRSTSMTIWLSKSRPSFPVPLSRFLFLRAYSTMTLSQECEEVDAETQKLQETTSDRKRFARE